MTWETWQHNHQLLGGEGGRVEASWSPAPCVTLGEQVDGEAGRMQLSSRSVSAAPERLDSVFSAKEHSATMDLLWRQNFCFQVSDKLIVEIHSVVFVKFVFIHRHVCVDFGFFCALNVITVGSVLFVRSYIFIKLWRSWRSGYLVFGTQMKLKRIKTPSQTHNICLLFCIMAQWDGKFTLQHSTAKT